MPNLKRPNGLVIKKGRWNKMCTECKRKIVKENITKELLFVICDECKNIFNGKCQKRTLDCKYYKIVTTCQNCRNKFESKINGRLYCYECKP